MIKRNIKNDYHASIYPVFIAIIALGLASVLILVYGEVLEPFFNFFGGNDDTVTAVISAPRLTMHMLFQILFPKGILLIILVGTLSAMLMHYQKNRYKESG